MADSYVGEIRMFGGAYAPQGWSLCNGSLLSVQDYQALFSLIGTTYGGNGVNNFALPDLRGRLPIGQGSGTGLTARTLGQKGGDEQVTLTSATIPAHNHMFNTLATAATTGTLIPGANTLTYAQGADGAVSYLNNNAPSPTTATLQSASVTPAGAAQPHSNMMSSFTVNFIISTEGIYPDRP